MLYTSRWWHLAAVQIGGAICLPIFVIGHMLARQFGLLSALIAVGIGNLVLLLLGVATALYSVGTRMTTSEAAADSFGHIAKPYFSLLLAVSMLGWFAIQLDMMAEVAGNTIGLTSTTWLKIVLGALITLGSMRGMKGIEVLANLSLPILVITIGYAVYCASQSQVAVAFEKQILFGGVTIAIAAAIGAVIDMPTYFRSAKSAKDAIFAAIILFGIALPLLEGVGIFLASRGSSDDLIASLMGDSTSALWKAWVALFIILAGWTTNNANLYSASIAVRALDTFRGNVSCPLGVIGTILSLLNPQEHLFGFLEVLGVLLSASGGVMVAHQISSRRTSRRWNIIGLIVGTVPIFGVPLTGSSVIDALAISFSTACIGIRHKVAQYEIC